MQYYSIDTVVSAYKRNSKIVTNKFWGALSIISSIKESIEPCRSYKFNTGKTAQLLEDLFCLGDKKEYSSTQTNYYVIFSKEWVSKLKEIMCYETPNFYDTITWFFRNKAFLERPSLTQLKNEFSKQTGLSNMQIEQIFSFEERSIVFSETKYTDKELLDCFNLIYENNQGYTTLSAEGSFLKANPGELSRAPFIQTLYANQICMECLLITQFSISEHYLIENNEPIVKSATDDIFPFQQIIYGAPGTGKSSYIKRECGNNKYENYRTTFHPDTDYASFVGSYKPITIKVQSYGMQGQPIRDSGGNIIKEDRIVYRFVFQSFLKAYIHAWKEQQNEKPAPVFLIIEEINRGNCAQIFGDIFQLLDRNENGFSDYPIEADEDLAQALEEKFADLNVVQKEKINGLYKDQKDVVSAVKSGQKLLLPNNLYIWATMNTSDQSLFPIDSAFKRRWDWKYIKIKNEEKEFKIVVNKNRYDWWDFLTAINEKIEGGDIQQEDKKLGYFFVKADKNDEISAKVFLSKVIFYLYNDVFKDFGLEEDFLKDGDGKVMTFASYFDEDGDIDEDRVECFIKNILKREPEDKNAENANLSNNDNNTKDNTKYSINGQGVYTKNNVAAELVKKFIQKHPDLSADNVVTEWNKLGQIVSHFVETEEKYNNRKDNHKKQVEKIQCNGKLVFVSTNGWIPDTIAKLQTIINNKTEWGFKIDEVKA